MIRKIIEYPRSASCSHLCTTGGSSRRAKMKIIDMLMEGLVTFVIAFVVSAAVSGLWNAAAHGFFSVDWESSFRLGVILGIISPWVISRGGRRGSR